MGRISHPLLIGSTATHYWFSEFRKKDVDCYATIRDLIVLKRNQIDVQLATRANGLVPICQLPVTHEITIHSMKLNVASPEILLMIKRIHLEFTDKWLKNIEDYIFLASKNIHPSEELINVFEQRYNFLMKNRTKLIKSNNNSTLNDDKYKLSDSVENCDIRPIEAAKFLCDKANVNLLPIGFHKSSAH